MKIEQALLILILICVKGATNKGVCYTRMVNGKLQKYGDCDDKQQSQVLKDLDRKLAEYERTHPKSCQDVTKSFAIITNDTGGVFNIYPQSINGKVEVYCDLEKDGGGWTVFQRRMDGSEDFYRGWDDYVNGFGEKYREFWLGLENLHQMTKNGKYELRFDLGDFDGNTAFASYKSFVIASSDDNYRIHVNVSSFTGTAGDSISYIYNTSLRHNGSLNGMPFTTKDIDHDNSHGGNCARSWKGGWWYNHCLYANLNGLYHNTSGFGPVGVVWYRWKNRYEYLKFTEMKFRKIK